MRVCPRCRSIYSTRTAFCGIDGERLNEQKVDPLIGRDLGRYTVSAKLGTGSTGCVYRAQHRELATDFAIKVLFGDLGSNETVVTRFKREAQAASRIRSPYVVSVTDFGTTDAGLVYLVMEYSPGRTLQDLMRDHGPMDPADVARVAGQIARGLDAAHALGFVHRDIKPANIVMVKEQDREVAKLLDFGIVRLTDEDEDTTKLTRDGLVVGTPAYMSPEQAQGLPITRAADLYSLGVVMFEMLEGRRPFKARSVAEMVVKHADTPPPPMHAHGGLELITMRLLAKSPTERFESASAVVDAIAELVFTERTRNDRPPRGDTALASGPAPAAIASNPGVVQSNPTNVESAGQAPFVSTQPSLDPQLTTAYMPVNRGLLVAAIGGALVAVVTVTLAIARPDLLSGTTEAPIVEVEPVEAPKPPPVPTTKAIRRRLDNLDGAVASLKDVVPADVMDDFESRYLGLYKRLLDGLPDATRRTIVADIDAFEADIERAKKR